MKIISCIKQVYDLDIVLENDWVVDETTNKINIDYANLIMNPYDETALELMLRITDSSKDIKTEVITIGNKKSEAILRKALAIGVDDATRIEIDHELINNPFNIAKLLHHKIKDDKEVKLVLCGRQSDIFNHGQTGQILAEKLGWSCFTNVFNITYKDSYFNVSRTTSSGIEHIKTNNPLVVTVTQSPNMFLRMATLMNTMKAKQKPINFISKELSEISEDTNEKFYNLEKLTVEKSKKNCIYLNENKNKSINLQLSDLINNSLNKGVK
ncbi:hypothetical protein CI105_07115 [Candidatus Izimaplasma bacterium ZiA1]|uniref:electron transfer flavoprotein subunit beta/FixA family protein n=1 Tax=Candidatus Izimoplasma sp. ZiA1 TaxID=2024899 RepID=UPI000BAA6B5F|nr:hypothetical protein CI105_07115 [Candidatus Izimaplasma bacterium ZiA1]